MKNKNVVARFLIILLSELGLHCIAVNVFFFSLRLFYFYFQVGLYVKRGCPKGSIEIEL